MKTGIRCLLVALACAVTGCQRRPNNELWALADADVESVDPHAFGGRYASRNVLANVYQGLVARDPDLRISPPWPSPGRAPTTTRGSSRCGRECASTTAPR